jgi:hypothetical protein
VLSALSALSGGDEAVLLCAPTNAAAGEGARK